MIDKLLSVHVLYHGKKVGTLTCSKRGVCSFEYDKKWLVEGFSISPLKLPLKSGIFTADYQPFNGNFGVFEDSLPGGYGEYLINKVLKKNSIDYQSLTPVQKLSLVGSGGLGALCYIPENKVIDDSFDGSFDQMQQIINDVLSEKTDSAAGMLFNKSGNSGGARPKCLYTDQDGHWIVKFRHIYDRKDIGEIRQVALDNGNVLLTVPISLRFRAGQKRVIFPENDTPEIDPMVMNLARAFRWQTLIDSGTYSHTVELAEAT